MNNDAPAPTNSPSKEIETPDRGDCQVDQGDWKKDLLRILFSKVAAISGLVLVSAVGARVALNWYEHRGHTADIPTVKTVKVLASPLNRDMDLPGNIEAVEEASIYSHVSGYLKKLYVDEGDTVKKGQLLAEIDAPDAFQDYEKVKAEYHLKRVTLERYTQLLKENVISEQEFDTVDADANEVKAKLDNSLATLDYTKIRAPFGGAIARRFKYPGDLISAAVRGGSDTPIFMLVNESQLRVAVNIPQIAVSSITLGHPADVKVDTLPDAVFHGTVSRIDALLDESTKTQRILVDLGNEDGQLHAGMFASVSLQIEHKDRALTVPREAIAQQGDRKFVYVLENGKVKEQTIKTGLSTGGSVEVLDGLKATDLVALPGGVVLADGMEVRSLDESAPKTAPASSPDGGSENLNGGAVKTELRSGSPDKMTGTATPEQPASAKL